MVVEAARQGSVREVLVIASALSIQDVRERPKEAPERAAELHRRFDVEGSDLLSIVALWDYLRDRQRPLSGNQFRRMCRDEYLNYLRVREWRDLYSQLRQVAGQLGIRPGVDEAHPDHVHRAVLAGLAVAPRHARRRESRVPRRPRLAVRDRARVGAHAPPAAMGDGGRTGGDQPAVGAPGGRRSTGVGRAARRAPRQARVRRAVVGRTASGRAVMSETVTLYGLPIVSNRTIGVDRVDPPLARAMFIRHALVAGDWQPSTSSSSTTSASVERVQLLEARVRRSDLFDDEMLFDFYDERLGDDVVSGRHFDRWWKEARPGAPDLLDLTAAQLANRRGIDLDDYPDTLAAGRRRVRLAYRYEPDTPLDGASLTVPLTALNQVTADGLDWGVPGYRDELAGMLVRSLPKDMRRHLIPMNETVAAAFAAAGGRQPSPGAAVRGRRWPRR